MIDRTDLQLMLIEEIFEMDTTSLIDLFREATGHELAICDDETEQMIGSLDTLDISDPPHLKQLLVYILAALGQRADISASHEASA